MSLTKLTENLNIHQSLPDKPAQTATELKELFDRAGNKIKQYINENLTSEIDEKFTTDEQNISTLETAMSNAETNIEGLETSIGQLPGEIIQEGHNSSAKYTKYSDGTLIQYGKISLTTYDGRSSGGLTYWSQAEEVTLPANYADDKFVVLTNVELANMNIFAQSYGVPIAKDKVRISYIATQDQESRLIGFICIGRWK